MVEDVELSRFTSGTYAVGFALPLHWSSDIHVTDTHAQISIRLSSSVSNVRSSSYFTHGYVRRQLSSRYFLLILSIFSLRRCSHELLTSPLQQLDSR